MERVTTDPGQRVRILEALADPVCREIIAELDEPTSGPTLTNRCETSSSTVYRKLELLVDCGIVDHHIEIEPDFSHSKLYSLAIDELTISMETIGNLSERHATGTVEHASDVVSPTSVQQE